jgi:hypothetical protein
MRHQTGFSMLILVFVVLSLVTQGFAWQSRSGSQSGDDVYSTPSGPGGSSDVTPGQPETAPQTDQAESGPAWGWLLLGLAIGTGLGAVLAARRRPAAVVDRDRDRDIRRDRAA